ncbi:cellulase family glycosylhydrolase [Paenibacillus sp. PAMC 26794]|uniref:cellulase family glycosylhydrolase n=1 Tax=Paenibacillus sp. PAMC 26794 TaxID=1257080 RepID=UPI000369D426|nr:cellulase family glycosylhydrolase [Paenibacillus sp. PAMC 26794]
MMKRTRIIKLLTVFLIALSISYQVDEGNSQATAAPQTPSQAYAQKMGKGWNVFNTYDSFRTDDLSLSDETSWGQPKVTQELILSAKAKGFDSIRIPMTAYTRYTLGADGHYVIHSEWLAKYKQVVDWAVDADLYVMINLHHDSWTWLSNWDGNKASEEYKRYVDLWTQLANHFKNEPERVMFETMNEPYFENDTGTITKQDKLDMINQAAYDVIRSSGGNNATRMIVLPTYSTSADMDKANAAYHFIAGLNDPNLIATVHFYSDWVFSGNLGRTGFDEKLYDGVQDTPRSNIDQMFNTLNHALISKGIGVVIGEYGWLSPDDGAAKMQSGEKRKYLEYLNYKASQYGVSSLIWPGAFWRVPPFDWHDEYGSTIQAANMKQRSSYSTGLNEIYVNQQAANDIQIPLTLNGNSFKHIIGVNTNDYSFNEATATLSISKAFINEKFNQGSNGTIADLVFVFSQGADWHQFIIKYSTPVFGTSTGTVTEGIQIPVQFNGTNVRRASLFDSSGNRLGSNSWFPYMMFGGEFTADYNEGTFSLLKDAFNGSVPDGQIKLRIEFYDGQSMNYSIQKSGNNVTGLGIVF